MDIVLGVSMTPTTVRMVLVEGEKADGATVDHDVFDITGIEGAATSSASEQVIAAILGTQESALAAGHRLLCTGVTWSDHAEAAALREALTARGIEDVTLISELHAAGALAQAAGRVVGLGKTALVFVERDTATVSVVDTTDGSIVKVDSRSLHSADAMAVLTEMVTSLDEDAARPEGILLLGSGVDVSSVKEHLQNHVTIPLSAPEHPEMALARGAALASANVPELEASTVGLAYSQDPDGPTAGEAYPAASGAEVTQLVGSDGSSIDDAAAADLDSPDGKEHSKPFLLAGSTLTAIFVVGVVALVVSLAVGIRPTVDTRPSLGQGAGGSSNAALPPPAVQNPPAPPPPAAPPPAVQPPPPETIPEPAPVVQQQPAPRDSVVQALAPKPRAAAAAPAPAPAAEPAPAPEAAPPAPAPVAPPPAPFAPPAAPAPAYVPAPAPPMVPILPPFIYLGPAPSYRPPVREYDPRWYPPPQQQWPQQPPQQQWPQQQSPSDSGDGSGSWTPRGGRDGSESPGPRGRSPLWPWPTG